MNHLTEHVGRAGGVEAACSFVTDMMEALTKKGQSAGEAICDIANKSKISRSTIRTFAQPSRRPKGVDSDVLACIWRAYCRFLRTQLRELEAQLEHVEGLHHLDPAHRRDLADETKALISRINDTLRQQ